MRVVIFFPLIKLKHKLPCPWVYSDSGQSLQRLCKPTEVHHQFLNPGQWVHPRAFCKGQVKSFSNVLNLLLKGRQFHCRSGRETAWSFPMLISCWEMKPRAKTCCLCWFTEWICQQQPPFQRLIHFPPTQSPEHTWLIVCHYGEGSPNGLMGWRALARSLKYSPTAQVSSMGLETPWG